MDASNPVYVTVYKYRRRKRSIVLDQTMKEEPVK